MAGGLVATTRLVPGQVERAVARVTARLGPLLPAALRHPVGFLREAPAPGSAGAVPAAPGDDTGGPVVNLLGPSEEDWSFLVGVLTDGTPRARVSAARALVLTGDPRAVPPLLDAAEVPDPDRDVFCRAALEILRHRRREEVLPILLRILADPDRDLSVACRTDISDRFAILGGRDPALLAGLAEDPSPDVRAFVAGYLAEGGPARPSPP